MVGIAADPSVGFNRSGRIHNMTTTPTAKAETNQPENQQATAATERKRCTEITAIGRKFGLEDKAQLAIDDGTSVAEFRATTLEEIGKRGSPPMTANAMPSASRMPRMKFGGDFHEFSLQRAVQAAITSDYSRAGYEREVQQELAQRAGRSAEGFFVPSSALSKRTLLTTSNTTNLVGVDHLGSAFIDSLENETVVLSAGATVLSDLSKDVSIPKMTAGTAAEWIAEGAAPSESTPTFGAVSLQPHQLAARASYTRKMLLQSDPNLEELLRSDLRRQTGIALDAAAITGTGSSGQPTGVLNTSGIGSVAIGTNGGAITWAKVVELETAVSIDNALMGRLGYVTNSAVTGAMKTIEKASNTAEYILGENAEKLAGHRFWMSNNVPSDLDKGSSTGVCSALIFGNWADLLVGEFGMMDLIVDPYTNADKGDVRIVVHSFWDIGVRHAESFAACLDITTS
ncbi:MAG: phage major capsid protein [Rhodobiaceae bacterium]|nr:phage major capsid protein [Rhodobiaceae bacterium]